MLQASRTRYTLRRVMYLKPARPLESISSCTEARYSAPTLRVLLSKCCLCSQAALEAFSAKTQLYCASRVLLTTVKLYVTEVLVFVQISFLIKLVDFQSKCVVTGFSFWQKGEESSGKIWLEGGKFTRGRTDIFNVEVVDALSPLSKIDIGHDNSGAGPGWHLDRVGSV